MNLELWRIQPHVAWQIVGDDAVVINLASGHTIGLNETGTFIWKNIETKSQDEIARELARTYLLDHGDALGDVAAFLQLLAHENVIEAA